MSRQDACDRISSQKSDINVMRFRAKCVLYCVCVCIGGSFKNNVSLFVIPLSLALCLLWDLRGILHCREF